MHSLWFDSSELLCSIMVYVVTPYMQTYERIKKYSPFSLNLIIGNSIFLIIFAYGSLVFGILCNLNEYD